MSAATVEHEREWDERVGCLPVVRLSGQKERLADLADDELLEVAKAARRHASWAQARELASIAELHRRRTDAESDDQLDHRFLSAHESVIEEVAVALTVTGNAAATLVHLADRLTGPLAATGAALEAGRIDLAKARVICDTTDGLPGQVADLVEAAALEKASDQTTGQLRRRIKRIAQRLAPESIEERKREAERRRRMELWENPSGTADLALCDLAVEDAHAVYNKITAAAHGLKAEGDPRPLSAIRADLALQLLHGTDLPEAIRAVLTQACTAPQPPAPDPVATAAAGATGVQAGGAEVGGIECGGVQGTGTESAGGQVTGGQVSGIEGSGAEVTGSGVTGGGSSAPGPVLPATPFAVLPPVWTTTMAVWMRRSPHWPGSSGGFWPMPVSALGPRTGAPLSEGSRNASTFGWPRLVTWPAKVISRATDGPATGRLPRCAERSRLATRPACSPPATSRRTAATSTTPCRGGPASPAAATWPRSADATTGSSSVTTGSSSRSGPVC
ncbi:DUF222 domain-containing protein [Actinomadura sp. K4S16]|uniref:DUF222 domain-containing protein n=1 Tax=Actinomadura sp. K4S16 TaxID=1316147 RepID=UPI0011ECE3CA|nr:DUF222 domain-containing protein [Actinomadura sp. K4S16]